MIQQAAFRLRLHEQQLFAAGTGLLALHEVNVRAWLPLVLVAGLALAARRLPASARAAVGAVLAPLALVGGMLHVLHARWNGLGRTDLTGFLLFGAAALLAAAAAGALLSRRRLPIARRLLRGSATAAGAVVLALFAVVPIATAMWLTGKPREPLTVSLGVPHRDVELRAADGVRLSGWYVRSRNGAAVVLVHGGGGDRTGVLRQARLLAGHGYGVLLYDERGRGRSGGQTNGMGWDWHRDVAAAASWLEARGVHRIAALGLSTGAEAVVTAAARDARIEAVVAEGVINRSVEDTRNLDDPSALPYWWVAFQAIRVQTHDAPPEPLTQAFRRVAPRPLLLIAAAENPPERTVAPVYRRAAGPTASFWLARTGHTHALQAFPRLYERRVVGFLDRALGVGKTAPRRHVSAALAPSLRTGMLSPSPKEARR